MLLVRDNTERGTRRRRVEQIPLPAPQHEHEVLAVVEMALRDDPSRPESTLDALLVAHLEIIRVDIDRRGLVSRVPTNATVCRFSCEVFGTDTEEARDSIAVQQP